MTTDIKQDFWKALADSPYVMVARTDAHEHAIPMNAQLDKDAEGAFWFFTTKDNRLAPGGMAMSQFVSKGHEMFACIHGTLTAETDRAVLDKLWNNSVETWYDGGKDDSNLLLLRYDLDDAEIWTADMGAKGYFKMLTGITMKRGEAGEHVQVDLRHG